MSDSIFKQIGNIINDSLNDVKTELQTNIDNGISHVISIPIISGSTTITNGNRNISISFSSESLLSNGAIVLFEIDFNDGSEIQTIKAINNSGTSTHTFDNDSIAGTTLDISIIAIDNGGNRSFKATHTLTYRDNVVPSGIITPSFNDIFYEGATSVTFSGATDSDGNIVSYKVYNISLSGVTVSNAIVNAGQPHIFNVANGTIIPGNPDISFTYMVSAIDNEGVEGASTLINSSTGFVTAGEAVYTTPGTYQWICPIGVKYVSIIAVGGGGGGAACGGGGGGLGWSNNVTTITGQNYTVVVGNGGQSTTWTINSQSGTLSSCMGTIGGAGKGGKVYNNAGGVGGTFTGDGGGNGGNGAGSTTSNGAGGGGAGGYTGNGGSCPNVPQGWSAGNGGGVGIFGQGPSGSGGIAVNSTGAGINGEAGKGGGGGGGAGQCNSAFNISMSGQGGSGGTTSTGFGNSGANAGIYGGGCAGDNNAGPKGGSGAVRIIWGYGRSFPFNAS